MAEWKPIETAPKDGRRILVWRPKINEFCSHVGIERWRSINNTGCWINSPSMCQPSHWMPLPGKPTAVT